MAYRNRGFTISRENGELVAHSLEDRHELFPEYYARQTKSMQQGQWQ